MWHQSYAADFALPATAAPSAQLTLHDSSPGAWAMGQRVSTPPGLQYETAISASVTIDVEPPHAPHVSRAVACHLSATAPAAAGANQTPPQHGRLPRAPCAAGFNK